MALNGFEFVVLFAWIVPLLIGALILYVIVRLGVKHGMRSYYADADAAGRPGHTE